ncbi:MAG TPA: hypothetical protein PKW08_04190 [Flavobacteriaceae bacterium]|nr:hypothetical protein [Flavobacteriaceae bacterium]MCB9212744.1 hypothetical protein [Alteromonas sp.]HPF11741.1 hypothetical protein [Flavobacteriaceae bacterium]HQU20767.1 hypothetical protein [Flavobacteriaceae bacterium]HQU64942.1 hypothetical protein [Flavobacteriaceae bacterium]
MKIYNNSKHKVTYHFYETTDKMYALEISGGLGTILPGKVAEFAEDSFPQVKVGIYGMPEMGVFGVHYPDIYVKAGTIYNMVDDLTFDGSSLKKAEVTLADDSFTDIISNEYSFIDTRNNNEDVKRQISFALKNSTSVSQSIQNSLEHTNSVEVGSKISGGIGEKATGELNFKYAHKAVEKLQTTYETKVNSAWESSISESYTLKPGFIYCIKVSWKLKMRKGTIGYLSEKTNYTMIDSASGSLITPAAYKTEADMPKDVRDEFRKFF